MDNLVLWARKDGPMESWRKYDRKNFDADYFVNSRVSGYSDYQACEPIVRRLAGLVYFALRINGWKPGSMLDVGCAYGFVTKFFLEQGVDSYGTDVSNFALNMAHCDLKGRLHNRALPDLKGYKEKQFDLVTCFETLEHLPYSDIIPSVERLYEITKKMLILMPNIAYQANFEEDPSDKTHISLLLKAWWDDLLDNGLRYTRDCGLEEMLNSHPTFVEMKWSGRTYVIVK